MTIRIITDGFLTRWRKMFSGKLGAVWLRTFTVGLMAAGAFLVFAVLVPKVQAADIAGYQEFYIPGDEQQIFSIMQDNDNNTALDSAQGMHCVIGVVGSGTNTTLYYDHWEDGYDFVLTNPATAD